MNELHAELAWVEQAVCRGMETELFFPARGESVAHAKQICTTCPVREPCLNYALDGTEKYGIWGGFSERERRALRRTRAKARVAVIQHGTMNGAAAHRRRGEKPCRPCLDAAAAYGSERKAIARDRRWLANEIGDLAS